MQVEHDTRGTSESDITPEQVDEVAEILDAHAGHLQGEVDVVRPVGDGSILVRYEPNSVSQCSFYSGLTFPLAEAGYIVSTHTPAIGKLWFVPIEVEEREVTTTESVVVPQKS